jgi:hypothetical protein
VAAIVDRLDLFVAGDDMVLVCLAVYGDRSDDLQIFAVLNDLLAGNVCQRLAPVGVVRIRCDAVDPST